MLPNLIKKLMFILYRTDLLSPVWYQNREKTILWNKLVIEKWVKKKQILKQNIKTNLMNVIVKLGYRLFVQQQNAL